MVAFDLFDELNDRRRCGICSNACLSAVVTTLLITAEEGSGTIGIALVLTQIAGQTGGEAAAQEGVRDLERDVVRVRGVQRRQSHDDVGLRATHLSASKAGRTQLQS